MITVESMASPVHKSLTLNIFKLLVKDLWITRKRLSTVEVIYNRICGWRKEGKVLQKKIESNFSWPFEFSCSLSLVSCSASVVYLKNTCVITAVSIGSFSKDYDNISENDNGKETRIDLFSSYVFFLAYRGPRGTLSFHKLCVVCTWIRWNLKGEVL